MTISALIRYTIGVLVIISAILMFPEHVTQDNVKNIFICVIIIACGVIGIVATRRSEHK
jgi:hypothetical protein